MSQKIRCDIHYCRSFTSLLMSLGYLSLLKNKKFKFLIISSQSIKSNHFNKNFFNFIKPILKKKFNKILIVNYERKINKSKFFNLNKSRSDSIKKNLKKINLNFHKFKIENVFSGGDDFESVLIKILGYKPNFYFTEHGIGNLIDGVIKKKSSFKDFLNIFILKLMFKLNVNYFYPVKYRTYIGILQKNISNSVFINSQIIKNKKMVNLSNICFEISRFLKKKNFFLKKKINTYYLITQKSAYQKII
jgi:hypothetical protein